MKNKNDNILIGKRLKNAREGAKLTQSRLHDLTGISITQISAYENGNRNIGLTALKKIADATGTTMDELYTGKGEDKPIITSVNKGKLIINCINALFEENVITILEKEKENDYLQMGFEHYYQIGFYNYVDILDDFVKKIDDFEKNKNDYPNPFDFKNQIIEAASKKINDRIKRNNKV